ncbi:MAG TPA: glycoside hydrolase family 9 protein, partial [Polyangiaceae bacterium]|nr:glycoside hydrolase family 9 protein [Polyangiaceae bacterium]
ERPGKDSVVAASLRTKLLQQADTLVANRNAHGYGRALPKYYWGSNGSVARACMLLQVANRLQSDVHYLDTCADQIAHLYGRNTYNRSYVTGEGKDPPLHPHHRPSAADGVERPFPGLLVGGSSTDAKGWEDVEENYEVNEVAVNWNAALAFALAGYVPATPAESAGGSGPSGAAGGGSGGAAGASGVQASSTATTTRGGSPSQTATSGGRTGTTKASSIAADLADSGGSVANTRSTAVASSTALSADSASSTAGCGCRVDSRTNAGQVAWILWLLSVLGARRKQKR